MLLLYLALGLPLATTGFGFGFGSLFGSGSGKLGLTGGQPSAEVTPKFFGFLKHLNPFSYVVLKSGKQKTPKEFCEYLGATWYGSQCVELVLTKKTFLDARHWCQRKGGDVWVPTIEDLSDPFFYQKLILGFPQLFKSTGGWFYVGITRSPPSGYKGINGLDLSKTPLVRTNDKLDPENKKLCSFLDYSFGNMQFLSEDCDIEETFVCEYDARRFNYGARVW